MQPRLRASIFSTAFIALGLGAIATARAGDEPHWSVSGYGTLGMVHSSSRDAEFTSSVLRHNGAGGSHPWSVDVDSNLGMQLDAALNKRWSAVLQVVSEQRLDNTYRPKVEWANIKYQATPELALRAGRIALPIFLTADVRKIGYVYPWVRPPVESYGGLPFSSSNGVDATFRWTAGPLRNASQVFYGRDNIELVDRLEARARRILGLSNTSDWGALSMRVNVIEADATIELGKQLFDGFAAFGPAGADIGHRFAIDHKRVRFANIGVNYDPGRWFLMAEAGRAHSESFMGSTRNYYVSGGWRWNSLTPYVAHAKVRAVGPTSHPGLPLAGLPPAVAGQAAMLNAGLNSLLATIPQQTSDSIGMRWDVAANVAFKLQYDRVTPRDGSRGSLINTTAAFRSDRTVQVTSAAVSFVY
jgi:Arc/MetJ family transcription regulator